MDNILTKIEFLFNKLFEDNKEPLYIAFNIQLDKNNDLWEKYEMLPNIRSHSKIVAILSLYFLLNLKKNNFYYKTLNQYLYNNDLNKLLSFIISSALLHDIGKTFEIKNLTNKSHAEIGYEILLKENRVLEAYSCKNHLIDSFIFKRLSLIPFIINIADKHVLHFDIVNIKQRFIDLRVRYPKYKRLFTNKVIMSYENSVKLFYTDRLAKIMNLYNNL